MNDYEQSLENLKGLGERLQELNQQAVEAYTPIVNDIVRNRSRDINHIELTLDGLLGFCYHESVLVLFKKLCRYYWDIDPAATARQIDFYREMWDSDDDEPDTDESSDTEGADA